jgi:hypothetical protein
MTIHHKNPEVPRALPPARLYLDDIEQVVQAFSEAALKAQGSANGEQLKTTFQVRDRFTTDLGDLPKIGKRTRDFTLTMERTGLALQFELDDRLHWWSHGLTQADAWTTFHKLEAILQPRILWLRARLRKSPGIAFTTYGFAAVLSVFGACATVFLLARLFSPRHAMTVASLMSVPAFFIGMKVADGFLDDQSTIVLRYSYDQAALREDRNAKILIGAISAAIAFALGIVSMALKHKYWP